MGKPKKKLSDYNLYMKRTLKGKMKGKTKAQRLAIFNAAARGWNKGKPKSVSRSSKPKSRAPPAKRSNPTGGTRRMTRNTFNMSKIYKLVRIAGFAMPAAMTILDPNKTTQQKGNKLSIDYLGYNPLDGSFEWGRLAGGWMPGIAATVITAVIPKINRFVRSIF